MTDYNDTDYGPNNGRRDGLQRYGLRPEQRWVTDYSGATHYGDTNYDDGGSDYSDNDDGDSDYDS